MPKPNVPALALCKASGRSRRKSARSQGVPRAVFIRLAPHPPRWSSVRSGQALTHPDTPPNEALALGRRTSDKRTGLPAVRGLGVRRARRVGTRLGPPGPSSASPLQEKFPATAPRPASGDADQTPLGNGAGCVQAYSPIGIKSSGTRYDTGAVLRSSSSLAVEDLGHFSGVITRLFPAIPLRRDVAAHEARWPEQVRP